MTQRRALWCWELSGLYVPWGSCGGPGCTWPDCDQVLCSWLYLTRLCTGVVCQAVGTGTVCPVPCFQVLCAQLYLPGLCVQVPCSGYTCLGDVCAAVAHGTLRVSVVQHLAGSGKETPSPVSSHRDVLLELLPAVTHQPPTSTGPELPCLFCPEELSYGGEIPATCGGAARHQHCPSNATVTQHQCDVFSCLSGSAALTLFPQDGCWPGAAEIPGHPLPIPRTVFGKTVVAEPGSHPGSQDEIPA